MCSRLFHFDIELCALLYSIMPELSSHTKEATIMTKTRSSYRKGEYHTAISRDCTNISFLSAVKGSGVIVIPGVLSMASDYSDFALALANNFTVHILERRGRVVVGRWITKKNEIIPRTTNKYVFMSGSGLGMRMLKK